MDRRSFLKKIGGATAGLAAGLSLAAPASAAPFYVPPKRLSFGVPRRALYVPETPLFVPHGERHRGSFLYEAYKQGLRKIDWENDTIQVALLSDNYQEVSGPGYARRTLTNRRIDSNQDAMSFYADDIRWENVTIEPRAAMLYDVTTDTPIMQIDMGGASVVAGDLKVEWSSAGILRLS